MNTKERPNLNGMCYVYYYSKDVLNPRLAARMMERLNVRSVRSWSHVTWLLEDAKNVNRPVADDFHRMYAILKEAGVTQIVGMSHYWFYPRRLGLEGVESSAVPPRDLAPGSVYQEFLDLYEQSWQTLVQEFPEVTDWETGNEFNHKEFLRPIRTEGSDEPKHFTMNERADICTDLMFRSARAIRSVRPEARIIMPGMAPVSEHGLGVYVTNIEAEYDGIIDTLTRIYDNIRSGDFGSRNSRDFFDALCWHPYYAAQDESGNWRWKVPDAEWVKINRSVYDVAVQAGDDGVDCYLSEFGFNDWGNPEDDANLIPHIREGFRLIREELPFVDAVHAYRLFDSMGYVTDGADHYAFFSMKNGHFTGKRRAYALQEQYGGQGSLEE